jgi:hypothetical protein
MFDLQTKKDCKYFRVKGDKKSLIPFAEGQQISLTKFSSDDEWDET